VANLSPQFDANTNVFQSQALSFLSRCRGEKPAMPYATGDEGATLMKILDAVYASSKVGREMAIR